MGGGIPKRISLTGVWPQPSPLMHSYQSSPHPGYSWLWCHDLHFLTLAFVGNAGRFCPSWTLTTWPPGKIITMHSANSLLLDCDYTFVYCDRNTFSGYRFAFSNWSFGTASTFYTRLFTCLCLSIIMYSNTLRNFSFFDESRPAQDGGGVGLSQSFCRWHGSEIDPRPRPRPAATTVRREDSLQSPLDMIVKTLMDAWAQGNKIKS